MNINSNLDKNSLNRLSLFEFLLHSNQNDDKNYNEIVSKFKELINIKKIALFTITNESLYTCCFTDFSKFIINKHYLELISKTDVIFKYDVIILNRYDNIYGALIFEKNDINWNILSDQDKTQIIDIITIIMMMKCTDNAGCKFLMSICKSLEKILDKMIKLIKNSPQSKNNTEIFNSLMEMITILYDSMDYLELKHKQDDHELKRDIINLESFFIEIIELINHQYKIQIKYIPNNEISYIINDKERLEQLFIALFKRVKVLEFINISSNIIENDDNSILIKLDSSNNKLLVELFKRNELLIQDIEVFIVYKIIKILNGKLLFNEKEYDYGMMIKL